jgi:hypothetical protein
MPGSDSAMITEPSKKLCQSGSGKAGLATRLVDGNLVPRRRRQPYLSTRKSQTSSGLALWLATGRRTPSATMEHTPDHHHYNTLSLMIPGNPHSAHLGAHSHCDSGRGILIHMTCWHHDAPVVDHEASDGAHRCTSGTRPGSWSPSSPLGASLRERGLCLHVGLHNLGEPDRDQTQQVLNFSTKVSVHSFQGRLPS